MNDWRQQSPMSAFDDERGPLCEQEEAQRLAALAAAGLTLDEMRAWAGYTGWLNFDSTGGN